MNLQNLPLVYDAASKAGFTGASLITAIAIAAAESGWDPKAVGDQTLANDKWGNSIGLWQIRSLQPGSLSLEPIRDASKLPDPYYNAKAAFQISNKGTNFQPWSTFANNAYKDFEMVTTAFVENKKKIGGIGFFLLVGGLLWIFRKKLRS